MPRARKPPKLTAAYERRNQLARAKGYKSYYDFRAHDNGRLPPGAARLSGGQLARARGHRSGSDLRREVRPGDLVVVDDWARNAKGQYTRIDIKVIDSAGRERLYRLSGKQLSRANLKRFILDLDAKGAVISPSPSLDVRRILEDDAP